ncbi:MAG: glutamate racemase [Gammaproteobacteria bacterium]
MRAQLRAPIGLFDSGIGGWSVLREVRRELPQEALLYVADSAYAPYGERSEAEVAARAQAIARHLVEAGAKSLVIACNTATAAAVAALRARFSVPIVAMEPAVKPAAAMTATGVVGVLATQRTVSSAQLARLRDAHGRDVAILARAATGLVERIEAGDFDGPATRALVERHVAPLREAGADVLVLGCTHFPLIRATIEAVAGPAMRVMDPAPAVARELRRRLEHARLIDGDGVPRTRVLTTGPVARMRELLAMLGETGLVVEAVDIPEADA